MADNLLENPFRDFIYNYLVNSGYKESFKKDYDIKNALDITHLFEFLESSQKKDFEKFKATYPNNYKDVFIRLLNKEIDENGLLKTIKSGSIEDYQSGTKFKFAYSKPELEVMEEGIEQYKKNIFSIRKELSYEDKQYSNRVDLAIFFNGFPIVLIELKKQTAGQKAGFEGTKQFREDRNPNELIFSFNRRCLAYFTIDEFVAFVATKLDSKDTYFLPFNVGDNDGAGNPVVEGKHSTYYMWEEILQKEKLLFIITKLMFIDSDGIMIFPRYHQLRAVTKIVEDVKSNGVGGRYLVWHSAGSGKTKTIAWLATRLINMGKFNTVIVISDRNIIDGQLGDELLGLDNKKGLAHHIDDNAEGLYKNLDKGGYIIVTTLQKFRPILNKIKQYNNRNYAIIIDEAHSSTAGKSLSKASETLTGKSLKESVELDDIYDEMEDGQNQIVKQSQLIKATSNVSYFAFTATPKKETIELFGTRTEQGKTYFDKYSMKQAVGENYILNPLLCYTKYDDYYEIAKKKDDTKLYDSMHANVAILNYVSSKKEVINTKTRIIMTDFMENRQSWLDGTAKAIIITPSRKHAVLYKLEVDKFLKEKALPYKSCVAFTGTIELDDEKYTERSMNEEWLTGERYDLRSIIHNNDDLRIIIVADKLQTGFDEKALSVMYIDKKFSSSVKAVQTISRINRVYPKKLKKTFILDFVNNKTDIAKYFREFYGGEIYLPMEEELNDNMLKAKMYDILAYNIFTNEEVENIYKLRDANLEDSGKITSIIGNINKRCKMLDKTNRNIFVAELKKFNNLYYYIASVNNSWNEKMDKFAIVCGILYNVLYEPIIVSKISPEELVELVNYSTKAVEKETPIIIDAEDSKLSGINTDVFPPIKKLSSLEELINKINTKYGEGGEEIKGIVDSLSHDENLQMNVKNSTSSAYRDTISSNISTKLTEEMNNSVTSGDFLRANLYNNLKNDEDLQYAICNEVIKAIKNIFRVIV